MPREMDEFKANYAQTLVTGFAHIEGLPVAILANNGILYSETALKATHFIELACQRKHPAAVPAEHHGLHGGQGGGGGRHRQGRRQDGDGGGVRASAEDDRDHRRLLRCRQLCHVRARLSPRFLFTWPNARISVMGGPQAAGVLATVRRENIEAEGKRLECGRGSRVQEAGAGEFRARGAPYYATARLWDDGIITPAETRRVVALALSAALNAPIPAPRFGVFRM